jgi:hypothetical protein
MSTTGKTAADRGKASEDAVQALLSSISTKNCFDFERNYDARSSQGHSYARRCGDFTWYLKVLGRSLHGVLEVKETEADARLPYSNMEAHQVGKLLLRSGAGGSALVLIHHSKIDRWRCVPISFFEQREGRGSWKLDSWETYAKLEHTPVMHYLLTAAKTGNEPFPHFLIM